MIALGIMLLLSFICIFVVYAVFDCIRHYKQASRAEEFQKEEKAKYEEKLKVYKNIEKDDADING